MDRYTYMYDRGLVQKIAEVLYFSDVAISDRRLAAKANPMTVSDHTFV